VGRQPQLDDFSGYLKSVVINSIFRKDGTPVQARVDVTIEGQQEQIGGQNPTSHAVNSRRVHTMIDGDTLQSVAYRELGKPAYWRAIADFNGIDDPLRLPAGTVLLIPTLADAARNP
jgi:nucleoid-associated protein YgaU